MPIAGSSSITNALDTQGRGPYIVLDNNRRETDAYRQRSSRHQGQRGQARSSYVLPDANGHTYKNQILGHRIGDPIRFDNTKDKAQPWFTGFNGYHVLDRRVIGDTVFLIINR